MAFLQKKNNAKSLTTDNPLSAGATTVNITGGTGSLFPSTGDFMLTIWDEITYPDPGDDPGMEIVRATARTSDAITITRAQEGTTGVSHASGSRIAILITAGTVNELLPTSSVDALADVDTTSVVPARDQVLKWNGTNWVPALYGDTFAMTISSFTSGQTVTQLIGAGVWKAAGSITFTASYFNPPPTSASIAISGTGGVVWGSNLVLTTPFTNVVTTEATNYPNNKDTTIIFTLTAYDGVTPRTSTNTITFRNNIKYGSSTATTWDSTSVNAFAGTILSSTYTGSIGSCTSGVNDYVVFAHPSSYTSIHATGFLFNGVACPFQSASTVTVTNSAGFYENYKVYRSTNKNLGTSTLVTSTSSNIIDPIYYGVSTKTSGYTEADIEGLATSVISNSKGRTIVVTAGAGQYIMYALPTRLGTVIYTVGGFEGGFETPETVSVTNVNGYTENYYIYRSTNSGLGTTTVVIT